MPQCAVGAASGELIATAIARQFYPDTDPSKLTEEQKQTVSTLASVSAGIAGGIAGNTAGAAAGASAGKNSAENNALNFLHGHGKIIIAVNAGMETVCCGKQPDAGRNMYGLNRIAERRYAGQHQYHEGDS